MALAPRRIIVGVTIRLVVLLAMMAGNGALTVSAAGDVAPVLHIMTTSELRAAYAGQTHESFYRKNVEAYGGVYFEETYYADGTLDYIAGEVSSKGFWKVANDRICFVYPDAPLSSGCFAVVSEAGCFYSYQLNVAGEPVGLASGEWWIRAKIRGTDAQCATPDLVS